MSAITLAPLGPVPVGPVPLAGDPARGDGIADDEHGVPADREAQVYQYVTSRGEISSVAGAAADLGLPVPEVTAAVTRLAGLHLLRAAGDRLVPMGADVAAAALVAPLERDMYQRRDLADQLRDRIEAITRGAGDAAPVGAIDALDGAAEIRGLFKLTAEVCRDEVVVLRPGHDDEDLLDELLEPCYSVLDRGVAVRVVCPHRYRAGFADRAAARRLTASGAEIRTLSQVPHAAVVFDRTLAVMLSLPGHGTGGPRSGATAAARRVRDPAVAQFLVGLFDQLWDRATPYAAAEPGYAAAVDDLQQSIVRLMAQGLTDEVVARRLGMSVRTVRRHIAVLLDNLGSGSRFQAGVQAATRFSLTPTPTA
jgi:DNA-binding CsgD family transcriptional regulator